MVRNVSFTVESGDCLFVVGENGAGKSTLLKGLAGLEKPTAGTIEYRSVGRGDIGYLPQTGAAGSDFPASVGEVMLSGFAGKSGPFYTAEQKKRTEETARSLGVWTLKSRPFSELSVGQRRRVLLVRALLAAGKLLLLDEPAAGLDPKASAELYRVVDRARRKRGIAVVMVSHDVEGVSRYATRVLHIKTEPLFFGSAEDYRKTALFKNFSGVNV